MINAVLFIVNIEFSQKPLYSFNVLNGLKYIKRVFMLMKAKLQYAQK